MKNQGQKVLTAAVGMIFFVVIGVMIGYNMKTIQIENQKPVHVTEADTTVSKRTPVYTRTEVHYFQAGDILTAKENGALKLWDTTMRVDMIIGIVSDSGTIEKYTR